MTKLEKLEEQYKLQSTKRKTKIRQEPSSFKRFWKWIWYGVSFPWVWLFYNIRDWRSLVCVLISLALWSASVWVFYLLYFITQNTWFVGIGSAVWVWWLSPVGSPFILLVTLTSIGLKGLFNIIRGKKNGRKEKDDSRESSTSA